MTPREIGEMLAAQMKEYESSTGSVLRPDQPYMLRMDGHCFHTLTKGMVKPFDKRLTQAMLATSMDLMSHFHEATACFTESDEISLIFPAFHVPDAAAAAGGGDADGAGVAAAAGEGAGEGAGAGTGAEGKAEDSPSSAAGGDGGGSSAGAQKKDKTNKKSKKRRRADDKPAEMTFGGRVQKIVSLVAGYTSARFNYHLAREAFDPDTEKKMHGVVHGQTAYFDCRAFNLPGDDAVVDNLLWRGQYDCEKNSKMMLAQAHYPHKRLQNMAADAAVRLLKEEKGIDWVEVPAIHRYGAYVKKERFAKRGVDPRSGRETEAIRTRVASRSFPIRAEHRAWLKRMLFSKFWNDVEQGDGAAGRPAYDIVAE